MNQIRKAVYELYGSWDALPASSQAFIENIMTDGQFEELYEHTVSGEDETKTSLVQFDQNYPGVMKASNIKEIADNLQRKTDRASVFALLHRKKAENDQNPPNKEL